MAAPTDLDITKYSFVQAKRDFDDARQHVVSAGWEEYVDSSNKDDVVKIWRKADTASGLYCYKVIGILKDVAIEDFMGVVNDLEYRASWDNYTHSLSKVQKVDPIAFDGEDDTKKSEEGDLIQWRVKFNFPFINDREYLFSRHVAVIDGTVIYIDRQMPDEMSPPKKGITRVANYNNSICLHQDGANVVMGQDYLTPLDLRMSLPNWLINWAAGAGVKSLIALYKEAVKKYPSWKEKKASKESK